MIVKNDMTKPGESAGCVVSWKYPKYDIVGFERPLMFRIDKKGNTFVGQRHLHEVSPEDAETLQDVGIFANAYSARNELIRVEFQHFRLRQNQ